MFFPRRHVPMTELVSCYFDDLLVKQIPVSLAVIIIVTPTVINNKHGCSYYDVNGLYPI